MRALRFSKRKWRFLFFVSRADARFFSCASAAASCASFRLENAFNSAADWMRKSLCNFSSRATKSRTALFNSSSNASISLTLGWLFTIAPHFFQQFLQLRHDNDRPVHMGGKFGHEAALEFLAL